MRSVLFLTAFLTLGLTACEGDVAQVNSAPAPSAPKAPTVEKAVDPLAEPAPSYTYNPIGKRDPFRSFFKGQDDGTIVNPTPLQRFEVDQYLLVGVVWGVSSPKAMVQDPEGTGHVVQTGTYIGKNWGKVSAITSTSVVITEEFTNIDGELVTNQLTLDLPVTELEL
ncbi:MAG: type IV pilus assembly protein PilP [Cognaticolwellia sp.]|jgi:type IV pilus assembly protein PilP